MGLWNFGKEFCRLLICPSLERFFCEMESAGLQIFGLGKDPHQINTNPASLLFLLCCHASIFCAHYFLSHLIFRTCHTGSRISLHFADEGSEAQKEYKAFFTVYKKMSGWEIPPGLSDSWCFLNCLLNKSLGAMRTEAPGLRRVPGLELKYDNYIEGCSNSCGKLRVAGLCPHPSLLRTRVSFCSGNLGHWLNP